jgi:hypothetical protein
MPETSALELQAALIAALKGDSGLAAQVGARVYDEPPQRAQTPYVRIGGIEENVEKSSGAKTDFDYILSIEVHSRPVAGRVEATRIAALVRDALDEAQDSMVVDGYRLAWISYLTMSTQRQSDGRSYIATVAFAARIDATP